MGAPRPRRVARPSRRDRAQTDQQDHSPEDHAILEAEYQKNSKPDKAARAEIVKKVSLEEKAVQVCHSEGYHDLGTVAVIAMTDQSKHIDLVPKPTTKRPQKVASIAAS